MKRIFRPAFSCLALGIWAMAICLPVWAEACKEQVFTMPVMLEGMPAGQLAVTSCGERRTVGKEDYLFVLYENMQEDDFDAVEALAAARKGTQWTVGEKLGRTRLSYDSDKVELALELPLELRNPSRMKMRGGGNFDEEDAVKPAALSAYTNIYVAGGYSQGVGMMQATLPVRVDTDTALNWNGNVLEGTLNYVERAEHPFMADNMRLVRDDTKRMVRYQAGELSYPITGFQNYRQVLGVGMARNFSLQPYRVTSPSGRANFTLQTPSTVDVYVNNQRVRTMQLARGTYELDDFPIVNGVNNVRLVITDAYGRTEERLFPVVNDADLLNGGLAEFALSAGVPVDKVARTKTYDTETPLVTGLLRYGVNDWLTVGANLQADENLQLLGLEQTIGGKLGTLKAELATSRREEDSGNAWRLEYRNLLQQDTTMLGNGEDLWSFVVEHRDGGFHSVDAATDNPYDYAMQLAYSRNLTANLTGTWGIGYKTQRDEGENDRNAFAGLYWRAASGLAVNLNATYSREEEYNLLLGLSWFPIGKSRQANMAYDLQDATLRLDGTQTTADIGDGLELRAGVVTSDKQDSAAGAVLYRGGRGFVRVSHDVVSTLDNNGVKGGMGTQTQVQGGTALVYADGAMAVAKPVNNSFLILSPRASLQNVPMTINPMETPDHKTVYEAKSSILGPAVLTDMMPYVYHKVQVGAAQQEDEDTLLGPSMFTVKPGYKSGTRLKVGSDALAYVTGEVVDEAGMPVLLASGEIMPDAVGEEGKEAQAVQMIFTNRQGVFTTEALKPGRYTLRLAGYPRRQASLVIPEKAKGKVQVGVLALVEPS